MESHENVQVAERALRLLEEMRQKVSEDHAEAQEAFESLSLRLGSDDEDLLKLREVIAGWQTMLEQFANGAAFQLHGVLDA
ncbi:MAG: hypothetical protein ACYCU0_03170 [Solirubrobacteraceae bacterium]